MNKKMNDIFNIIAYFGLYSNVYKGYITTDVFTIQIYHKKEKKYILYFLKKLFIFSFLIWALQCFNNWYSFRSWNYKNNSNILNLGANRLLAEKIYKIGQGKEELKLCEQQYKVKTELEQNNGQKEIEECIDAEQESGIEAKKEDKELKCNKKTLKKYNNISKVCSLYFAFILSFISFLLSIINVNAQEPEIERIIFLCINLSVIIFSVLLIMEKIKIKHKEKLQLSN
ncbi:fam-h protein [Plasmodium relictum]|uniref:Fam-h protein n=1 Tax=Plasmodium relictum TaxID=85471 RepID=A0A1J1GKV4_PLARL|nr:fam-h protein [Plasmodium relictum]CRG85174.1 fam-h protein [Plasmodium relictum]